MKQRKPLLDNTIEEKLAILKEELVDRCAVSSVVDGDYENICCGLNVFRFKSGSAEHHAFLNGAIEAVVMYKNLLAYGHIKAPKVSVGEKLRGYVDEQ